MADELMKVLSVKRKIIRYGNIALTQTYTLLYLLKPSKIKILLIINLK